MLLLMTVASYQRVGERVQAVDPTIDVVTVDESGAYRSGEQPLETVDPDIVWLTLDAYPNNLRCLMRPMLEGKRTRWTQGFMAGLEKPIFSTLMNKGIRVTKNSAQAPSMAEYVMGHALSLLLPISAQAKAQRAHEWTRIPYREISNTRWALVGFGNIGREIATRLRPFGAELTVLRKNVAAGGEGNGVVGQADLLDELPNKDVVVLACALNGATRKIANEAFFAAMKPNAILINIGRGELIDHAALRRGLESGRPAQAVLDVFETEPLPPSSWLWDHPRVRISAHCSNAGDGVETRSDALFLDNLKRFLGGEPLLNEAHLSETDEELRSAVGSIEG